MPHLVRVHDDGRADVGFDALLDDGREASRERDEREAGGCQEGVIGGDAPHRDNVYCYSHSLGAWRLVRDVEEDVGDLRQRLFNGLRDGVAV